MRQAQTYCSRNRSVTVSAEKVEKVVESAEKAGKGKKPCFGRQHRIVVKILDYNADKIAAGQVRHQSTRKGQDPEFNAMPNHQRSHAPSAAPVPTAVIAQIPILLLLQVSCFPLLGYKSFGEPDHSLAALEESSLCCGNVAFLPLPGS